MCLPAIYVDKMCVYVHFMIDVPLSLSFSTTSSTIHTYRARPSRASSTGGGGGGGGTASR